jgi:GNAT superfamily N-acetyltransferase
MGPFYCVFRWDPSKFNYPEPNQPAGVRVRFASESEIGSVAQVWYAGLEEEEGSPWQNYLKTWTPNSAARWFLDSTKRLGAKFLIAEKEKIVGVNGIVFERNSGKGRFFTGIVVAPNHRKQGIGTLILHQSLLAVRKEGLRSAEVETIQGIPAARYLYSKYGGMSTQVPA